MVNKILAVNFLIKQCLFWIILTNYYLLFNNLAGQSIYKLDSIESQLINQKEDSNKVKTFLLLSREYSKTDPGKAMDYSFQAYNLASNLNYTLGIIDAIIENSNDYTLTGQLDSALVFSQKAIHMSDSIRNDKRKADSYSMHANILLRKGGFSAAQEYYFNAQSLYQQIGDSTGYMNSLNGLGIVYYRQAEYDSAIYYYFQFLRLCEKLKNEEGIGKGYVNLGVSYYELKDFKNARYYLNKSIKVNEKYNNLRLLSIANKYLGSMAYDENSLDEAMHYYTLCQEQNTKINDVSGLAQAKNNIGNVYDRKKEYAIAMNYYIEAKDLFDNVNNIDGFIAAYKNVGLMFERTKNYTEALKIYDSCLVLAKNANLTKRIVEVLYNINKTHELRGNFKMAYKVQTEMFALMDSIIQVEKAVTITNLKLKYEKEKDQARILALENENLAKNLDLRKRTNQRNGFMYSGLGLVLIITFIFMFYRLKTQKDRIIAEQKIQQLEEEKKLLAAHSIVSGQEEERKRIAKELHDGLGVLLSTAKMQFSAIKNRSTEDRSLIERATKLLEQASGDVRRISHNMMPGLLSKFGFFEAVEDLFEDLNEIETLTAEIKIEGETTRLRENIEIMLYRIVQEMVNNTLRHADAHKVSLNIKVKQDQLLIQFTDDGKGFDVPEKLDSKTIGLTSILSRVKFLNGTVNVESKPGEGCAYFIQIPKINA